MIHAHLLDPDTHLHHEHSRCHLAGRLDPGGTLQLTCRDHSADGEPGLVVSVCTCRSSAKYGVVLLNVVAPGCSEVQAVKITGGLDVPWPTKFLPPLPPDEVMYRPIVESEVQGYLRVYCDQCSDRTLKAEYWLVHPGEIVVRMRCLECWRVAEIALPALEDIGVHPVCDHLPVQVRREREMAAMAITSTAPHLQG